MSQRIDFNSIDAELLSRAEELIQTWMPSAKRIGSEMSIGNVRGDPGESLKFSLKKGCWKDWATGESGPGLISLYAAIHGVDLLSAARELLGNSQLQASRLHVAGDARILTRSVEGRVERQERLDRPPPEAVTRFNGTHPTFGDPVKVYEYRDLEGVLFLVGRYEPPSQKKKFLPYTWSGEFSDWICRAAPKPWPLYRLDKLTMNPRASVLIVEGEKCVEAAERMFPALIVTTWPGGAHSVQYVDLEPLRGRVISAVWPDADDGGIAAGRFLAERLASMGCRESENFPGVKLIDVRGQPDGWDIADAIGDGWTADEIVEWGRKRRSLVRANDPKGTSDSPVSSQASAVDKSTSGSATQSRPKDDWEIQRQPIRIEAGDLHLYAEKAEKLIANDVYVRGQELVRIGNAPELAPATKGVERSEDQCVIVAVNAEYLRRRLSTVALFLKPSISKQGSAPVDCPPSLAKNILLAGDWRSFRPLDGIATAPFLRPNLTLCDTPGYDITSRIFYAPNAKFLPLPTHITKDAAVAALHRVQEPFEQFPFSSPEAKAAFLSHLLAAAARHAIDTMPVMTYTAPIVASGKTLLAGMASEIADGIESALRPFTDEQEELRKVLMSVLLAGDRTIVFDNVPNGAKVKSPILCGFVTAASYSDRKLGVSESPRLPNRSSVVLTGNNISPAGDLARRSIVVRLDANSDTARGRTFRIPNLKEYVRRHRTELLRDALIVILGYIEAGLPMRGHSLESFERWSHVARDPLLWLGHADPVDTQQLETDDELGPLIEAFEILSKWPHSSESFRAGQLASICGEFAGNTLRETLQAADCGDATDAKKVGYWLREHRDRVAGRWKLVKDGESHGTARWRLKAVK